MTDRTDILLTQKFIPEMGGSIRWMYEVYRAWPWPVQVITHDVYRHPPNTPECRSQFGPVSLTSQARMPRRP